MADLLVNAKNFDELSNTELYALLKLRAEVFIVEQECIYQDIDDYDQQAVHVCAYVDSELVAYTRLIKPGIKYAAASLSRVVTKPDTRSNGYGKQIVSHGINYCKEFWPHFPITISAQEYLQKFYESFGFEKKNAAYMEDGIPHIEMTLETAKDV